MQAEKLFTFQPRWKEELVVTGQGGSLVLELPMGILSVYFPTEERWAVMAPVWARGHWARLRTELLAWCADNNAQFHEDRSAWVYSD